MNKLNSALAWAARGFRVFPLQENSKKPIHEDWCGIATSDAAQISLWWRDPLVGVERDYNIGVDATGLLIVDLDNKHSRGGQQNFEALGGCFDTLTVRTPTGGYHLYYDSAGLDLANSQAAIAAGVDTRGWHGYVVAPGSTIEGAAYTMALDAPIADAPRFVWQRVKLAVKDRRGQPDSDLELDMPGALALAIASAGERPPAIEGLGGDALTYQTACSIRDLGVSEPAALEILLEYWNPRCSPPWAPDELAAKVANAYAYAQRGEGEKSAAVMFGGIILIAPEYLPSPPAPGFVSFADLLLRDVPPVQELIPGLIEQGTVTFLSAPGGSHKSRLAVQWGLCLDTGTPVFGRTVRRSTFVYLSYEDHADEVTRRAQVIARHLQLRGVMARYCDLAGKDSPLAIINENGTYQLLPFWPALIAYLKAVSGHKFVVLDGTYNALRFAGQAKINETSVMLGISLLQRICDECDSTVMSLWHPSQSGQERGDASGWSVAWHNAPRARLSLSAVKGTEDAFELRVEKRNHGSKGKPMTLYWSDGVLLPHSDIAAADQESRFLDAVVEVAIIAATRATPIQKQRRPEKWVFDEIEAKAGRRPALQELKDELARALRHGKLRYQLGYGRNTAGYYPSETSQHVAA